MSKNGEPDETRQPILSVEELEALLRAPSYVEDRDSPTDRASRVLLVSKRTEDLDPLAHFLEGGGLEVRIARNPFTALDHLRARDFEAVIADFSLWRAQKDLLFERISQLETGVEVIYVCDPDETTLEEARRTKALWVMRRPIDAAELLGYVRGITGGATDEETVAEPMAPPVETRATSSSELDRWYKFFFNVRREIRQWGERERRWQRFLDLFVVAQGGGAVALLDFPGSRDAGPDGNTAGNIDENIDEGRALRVVSVKAALDNTTDRGHGRQILKRRIQQALTEASQSAASGGNTSVTSNGALVLRFPRAAPRRLLISVAPPSRRALEIPLVIADELIVLLEEVDRPD